MLLKFGTFQQSFINFNEQTVKWNGSELAREVVSNVTDKCTTLDMHRSLPCFLDERTLPYQRSTRLTQSGKLKDILR